MEVLAEATRQALHIGNLEPTTLEAHHRMLQDLQEFANHIQRLDKAVNAFERHTRGFLDAGATFLKDAPFPRQWRQMSLTTPAEPLHAAVPAEYAHLFVADLHDTLAEGVPPTVSAAIRSELLRPLELWWTAYESAKVRMPELDRKRLQYDAARRKIEPLTSKPAPSEKDEKVLADQEEKYDLVIREFEAEEAALHEHLTWLVNDAARLKAYYADVMAFTRDMAVEHTIPKGLLEPFPTHVLKVEVVEAVEVVAAAPAGESDNNSNNVHVTPDDNVVPPVATEPDVGVSSQGAFGEAEPKHAAAAGAKQEGDAGDASAAAATAQLPGEGVQPGVGGVGAMLKDAQPAGVGTPASDSHADEQHVSKQDGETAVPSNSAFGVAAEADESVDQVPVNVFDRSPHPYEAFGSPIQLESRDSDAAIHFGLGLRARIIETRYGHVGPAVRQASHPSDLAEDPDANCKQLSTVLAPPGDFTTVVNSVVNDVLYPVDELILLEQQDDTAGGKQGGPGGRICVCRSTDSLDAAASGGEVVDRRVQVAGGTQMGAADPSKPHDPHGDVESGAPVVAGGIGLDATAADMGRVEGTAAENDQATGVSSGWAVRSAGASEGGPAAATEVGKGGEQLQQEEGEQESSGEHQEGSAGVFGAIKEALGLSGAK